MKLVLSVSTVPVLDGCDAVANSLSFGHGLSTGVPSDAVNPSGSACQSSVRDDTIDATSEGFQSRYDRNKLELIPANGPFYATSKGVCKRRVRSQARYSNSSVVTMLMLKELTDTKKRDLVRNEKKPALYKRSVENSEKLTAATIKLLNEEAELSRLRQRVRQRCGCRLRSREEKKKNF